jgi:hypothetical protein
MLCLSVVYKVTALDCSARVEVNSRRLSAAGDSYRILRAIAVRPYQYVLIIIRGADGTAVANTSAVSPCEWWRCLCESLEFTYEETWMRWLVVTLSLPYHSLTILVVIPQRRHTVRSRSYGSVNADVSVVGRAHNDFLTPVTEDVTRSTWVLLGTVDAGSLIVAMTGVIYS